MSCGLLGPSIVSWRGPPAPRQALSAHGDPFAPLRSERMRLAGADAVAFLDVDVHAARERVLTRLAPVLRHDDDLALTLDDAATPEASVASTFSIFTHSTSCGHLSFVDQAPTCS